jgi:hypothetical protein
MTRAAAMLAVLFIAAPLAAATPDTRGDEFSFAFIDVKRPEDTIIVLADNYDQAVNFYCIAQDTDRKTVEKRFKVYDVETIRNTSEDPDEVCITGKCEAEQN